MGRPGPARRPPAERFSEKVSIASTGCWEWTAGLGTDGYGRFYPGEGAPPGTKVMAHRFSYQLFVGEIPEGLDIDHLCRNHSCVNPDHLEPVTRRENLRRGVGFIAENFRKSHCPAGHPYDDENTWTDKGGGRHCRTCHRDRERERYRRSVRG